MCNISCEKTQDNWRMEKYKGNKQLMFQSSHLRPNSGLSQAKSDWLPQGADADWSRERCWSAWCLPAASGYRWEVATTSQVRASDPSCRWARAWRHRLDALQPGRGSRLRSEGGPLTENREAGPQNKMLMTTPFFTNSSQFSGKLSPLITIQGWVLQLF